MPLTFTRHYSALPELPTRTATGRGPDGTPITVTVPEPWSQTSVDILCSRYLDRTRRDADGSPDPESSAAEVAERLADTWTSHGRDRGYFATDADAEIFRDEAVAMLLRQVASPNSTQFFHTGTRHTEQGDGTGWAIGPDDRTPVHLDDVTGRPPSGPCTLLAPGTGLAGPGDDWAAGATGQWATEAVTFVGGGGVGTNYSHLPPAGKRRDALPLMEGLRAADRAAGALAAVSRRRPARMVVVDADHPDITAYVTCKADEEDKAAALAAVGYDISWTGVVYTDTLAYQNANHSVAVGRNLLDAVDADVDFPLHYPTTTTGTGDGEATVAGSVPARTLWHTLAEAAWRSADPGLVFTDTANAWHTAPTLGPIRTPDACSVYFQADDTTSTLAALRLTAFWDVDTDGAGHFDIDGYRHAVRIWTVVQDITQGLTWWPTRRLAERTAQVRALGLGYCDLGGLLMRAGLGYDSDAGRAVTAALTAALHFGALATSAELADALGAAPAYAPNRETVARVMRNHARAAGGEQVAGRYERLPVDPQPLDRGAVPAPFAGLLPAIDDHIGTVLAATQPDPARAGNPRGLRNLHLTCLQPTGTTGLFMGADSTALEPVFSLLTHKTLVDGSGMLLVADCVEDGLRALGYADEQVADVRRWIRGVRQFVPALPVNTATLEAAIASAAPDQPASAAAALVAAVEAALPASASLRQTVTSTVAAAVGAEAAQAVDAAFAQADWELCEAVVCGRGTVVGAPHVDPAHYPVFAVAVGDNALDPAAHVRACAAVAPFLSGSAAKTVNLPTSASVADIAGIHRLAHDLGTKCVAVYRDGAKLSQPLRPRPVTATADAGGCFPVAAVRDLAEMAGLRDQEWLCAGSAPLAVRGVRVAEDVDLVVSPEMFADLADRFEVRCYPEDGQPYVVIPHPALGDVAAVPRWGWGDYDPPVRQVLDRAEVIHDIPVLAWADCQQWKEQRRRSKDVADLELIATLRQPHA